MDDRPADPADRGEEQEAPVGVLVRPIETLTAKRTPGTKRPHAIRSGADLSSKASPLATRSSFSLSLEARLQLLGAGAGDPVEGAVPEDGPESARDDHGHESSVPCEAATEAVVSVVSPGKIGTIASANTSPEDGW